MDAPEQRKGDPLAERFARHVDRRGPDECWPWTGQTNKQGYGQFTVLAAPGAKRRWRSRNAQCIAWEIEHGRPLVGWGLHTCDNPPCCNPAHVYEGDGLLNAQDTILRDRRHRGPLPDRDTAKGVRNGRAHVTDDVVREVRRRYAAGGVTQQAIADEIGIDQTQVSRIVRRRTWRHVS